MSVFPERLRELRQSANLTQQQLATRLNVSLSAINKLERAEREPSIDMLLKIGREFDCSADYLLGNVEHKRDFKIRPSTTLVIPVVESVPCDGIIREHCITGYKPFFTDIEEVDPDDHFWLKILNDEMTQFGFKKNSYALIRKENELKHGSYSVICVENETVFRLVQLSGGTVFIKTGDPLDVPKTYKRASVKMIGVATYGMIWYDQEP